MESDSCPNLEPATHSDTEVTPPLSMRKILSAAQPTAVKRSSPKQASDAANVDAKTTTEASTSPHVERSRRRTKRSAQASISIAGRKRTPQASLKPRKPRQRSKSSNTGQAERQRRQLRLLSAELDMKQQEYHQFQLNVNYLKQKERMLDRFLAVHNAQPCWFRVRQAQAELRWQCTAARFGQGISHMQRSRYVHGAPLHFTKHAMLEQDLRQIATKWREVVPALARVLKALDAQPGQPLLKAELTRLMFDLFTCVLTIIVEPDMWVRFLTTNMETGQQGVPTRGLWERVVESMQVTNEQRYKAFLARDIYLGQMKRIMAEREELLQSSMTQGIRGSGDGLGTAVSGCIAVLLGENIMHQHHVSLVFNTVAAMELWDSVQYARSYVACYPWVPDTLAIVDVMACGLDEAGVQAALATAEKPLAPDNSSDDRVQQMWSMMQDPVAYDERYQRTRLLKSER